MKRLGGLMEAVVSRDNLCRAFSLASRGRRQQPQVRRISADLDRWLDELGRDVRAATVAVGRMQRFVVHDPKRRVIHAAPFRERVLHHAIMNVVAPVLERRAIDDSFASRPGKGVHRARLRAQKLCARWRWYLKLDVRRYFDSVSHDIVRAELRRLLKDPELLGLLDRILGAYSTEPGRGLPIGSLVSQHLANAYLGPLDRYIKEELLVRGYVRYMDDFLLFADERERLQECQTSVEAFAAEELALTLKGNAKLGAYRDGIPFLGARITPTAIYPNRRARRRLLDRLARYEAAFSEGEFGASELQRRASALLASVDERSCAAWRARWLVSREVDA